MDDILAFVLVLIVLNVAVKFCDAGYKSRIIYHGSIEDNITCNGHDVINITRTELHSVPTKCDENECNLSEGDRKYIHDSCDRNTSCEVSLDHLSSCISKRGFINANYVCQRDVLNCDVENDLCTFTSNDDWKRVKARYYFTYRDHTTGSGNGHHFYVYSGRTRQYLRSKMIARNYKQCLSFYYSILWETDSMQLYRYKWNGTSFHVTDTWDINYHRYNEWKKMTLTLKNVGDYYISFKATGKYHNSAFAIDDIMITNIDCEQIKDCDFESDNCNWDGFDKWMTTYGSTRSRYTGPSRDHSGTSDKKKFMYMDASNMKNGERTNLSSPLYAETGELCFVFWYYMYGYRMGSLNVYYESASGHSKLLFKLSGNKGQLWHDIRVDVNASEKFKIILEGRRGDGWSSDIAIDDISLLPGNCSGFIPFQKSCTSVEHTITLDGCHSKYQSSENMHIYFDPKSEDCTGYLGGLNNICLDTDYYTKCDAHNFVGQNPSCFALNSLMIEYTCEETGKVEPVTEKDRGKVSRNIGMVAGLISGVLLIVGLTCTVLFIIYRRKKQPKTRQNKTTMNDCMVSLDSYSQGITVNLTNTRKAHSNNDKNLNIAVHSDMQHNRATSNPSYTQDFDYTSSANVINVSDLDLDNEYMNMPDQKKNSSYNHNFGSKYNVQDPKRIGYDRTKQDVYELASAVTQIVEDDYVECESGQYDISGNSGHRLKDTIYDHSIDDMYDSSHRGRHLSTGDDTYDHTFGKQIEDLYDIAQS